MSSVAAIKTIARHGREKILQIADNIRARFDIEKIDDVARAFDITVVRSRGPSDGPAGFAYAWFTNEPIVVESLSRPNEALRVWGEYKRRLERAIVININSNLQEREIFYHELYHTLCSPDGVDRAEEFRHSFNAAAIHNKEERRADEFAAAVLIDAISSKESLEDIVERFSVSYRLAKIAMEFYSSFNNSIRSLTTAEAVGKLPAPLP